MNVSKKLEIRLLQDLCSKLKRSDLKKESERATKVIKVLKRTVDETFKLEKADTLRDIFNRTSLHKLNFTALKSLYDEIVRPQGEYEIVYKKLIEAIYNNIYYTLTDKDLCTKAKLIKWIKNENSKVTSEYVQLNIGR